MTNLIVDEDPDMLNELPRGSCARDNVPNHGLQIPREFSQVIYNKELARLY
jgi:hypothetical protein